MKVIYENGELGEILETLSIESRYSKASWKELEKRMKDLGIVKFADPLTEGLGAEMISIEYVRNQVAAHEEEKEQEEKDILVFKSESVAIVKFGVK